MGKITILNIFSCDRTNNADDVDDYDWNDDDDDEIITHVVVRTRNAS